MRTVREFIGKHRAEIDEAIRRAEPNARRLDDERRRVWILTHDEFYRWATGNGAEPGGLFDAGA